MVLSTIRLLVYEAVFTGNFYIFLEELAARNVGKGLPIQKDSALW
jgi:hypothetical protein